MPPFKHVLRGHAGAPAPTRARSPLSLSSQAVINRYGERNSIHAPCAFFVHVERKKGFVRKHGTSLFQRSHLRCECARKHAFSQTSEPKGKWLPIFP